MKVKRSFCFIVPVLLFVISSYAIGADGSVKLSFKEIKKLNTFFSNFSEASVEPFKKGEISDSALIRFCVSHNEINNSKVFVSAGKANLVKIRASLIDETAVRYFGKKISSHQSVRSNGISYGKGWYLVENASGEMFRFSQVKDFLQKGDDVYTATVNVYSASSGWTGNVHGTAEEWKKNSADDVPELSAVMKALVRKVKFKGQSRYILLEYIRQK